jgi:spore maturation protein CgeB
VYTGLCAGLCANGVSLIEGRLDTILNWYGALIKGGVEHGVLAAETFLLDGKLNRSALASAHITRAALMHRPDWLIVVSGHNYNVHDAAALRKAGIKTALICTESPYWAEVEPQMGAFYDVVFTNERSAVASFKHPRAHYLPHAYNPDVHTPAGPRGYAADVVFIGSLFDERKRLFYGVDWTGIDFILRGHFLDATDIVANEDVAAYYRAAKVSLNHHRTTTMHGSGTHITSADSLGPRAYEIPACGGFMLCDDSRAEGWDVFGDYFPTYRAGDSADLERQVKYWLKQDGRREETARAMHAAVQPHNWVSRAKQVLEVLCP